MPDHTDSRFYVTGGTLEEAITERSRFIAR